jgi:adenylosuccinate synthase
MQPELFSTKLRAKIRENNSILQALGAKPISFREVNEDYLAAGEKLRPFVTNTVVWLHRALQHNTGILFEGAQVTFLDIDHGTYPYGTSSNTTAGGACTGSGVPPHRMDVVLGVVKAYTTRVGGGPFPTELLDETGEHIRQEGREFGTVTGRPRRCGWLDLVAVKYTTALNGVDAVAVMCLDVLSKLDSINVCVAYDTPNGRTEEFPVTLDRLADCKPVFRTVPGWKKDLRSCRTKANLPKEALAFLDLISEQLATPVTLCSVGPARDATIFLT